MPTSAETFWQSYDGNNGVPRRRPAPVFATCSLQQLARSFDDNGMSRTSCARAIAFENKGRVEEVVQMQKGGGVGGSNGKVMLGISV